MAPGRVDAFVDDRISKIRFRPGEIACGQIDERPDRTRPRRLIYLVAAIPKMPGERFANLPARFRHPQA
jgi:hypothetical protein